MIHRSAPGGARRVAVVLLSGALVGSASVGAGRPAGADPDQPAKPFSATVQYQLTGSGVARYVTYAVETGQLHAVDVPLPWSMQVTRAVSGDIATAANLLSAQGAGPGSITCSIEVNGRVVATNTATGEPPRVLCENHDPVLAIPGTTPPNPAWPWLDHP